MEAKKGESKNLVSPIPLGRPDTQAKVSTVCEVTEPAIITAA